ncbi:MAG: hypothetical protein IJ071_02170 [Ruminococcus sp.]|nr:hypothetical protein [Ruminococcus sp.]
MAGFFDKRVFFTLLTAATVSGFIVICTLGQSLHRQKVEAKISAGISEITQPERTVREYGGRIGVFMGESSVPYRVIDYDVSLLSDLDRQALEKGIVIGSDYELSRFIEDIAT